MLNKVILIARLGQNAGAKTAQNNREYVVLNIATQESWKNDKGDYENRIERALEDDYLSRDPSTSKRASYIRRTMEKARRWAER